MAVDLGLVRHALTVARDAEFATVELEAPNLKFTAELGRGARKVVTALDVERAAESAVDVSMLKCPLVGYFGVAPTPIKVGDRVTPGDVVCIVAALGIPNEVFADLSGIVEAVFVADGDPVEYGQPLIKVKAE
jgi:biotin carboxyl carrier protein